MTRAALVVALLALAARPARAHDWNPGVLSLTETEPGRFAMAWAAPVDSSGEPAPAQVVLPAHCRRDGGRVDCGARGLAGELAFQGLHAARMKVVVVLRRLDGSAEEHLVTGAEPRLALDGARGAWPWLRLGAEHILGGADHLAFLLGLLLVLGRARPRRVVATVTAFTVAHSLTLALAVLDLVRLPRGPVEATIAASVVLVAREALHDRPTATRRWPWLAAGAFGLFHGLGFAGALVELGLPGRSVAWSLLWFNAGVELAQLVVVAAALALGSLVLDRAERAERARRGMAYVLGSLGAAWLVDRAVATLGG